MTIKGFQYENAIHVSFSPETEESDINDNLLVTVDNTIYECGEAEIIPIWTNSEETARTYLICLDSDNSEMKDKKGIAFILDEVSETMTFQGEDGHIRVQSVVIVKDDQNGQITEIWGDPCEMDILDDHDFMNQLVNLAESDDPDDLARFTAISDNLENLIVE